MVSLATARRHEVEPAREISSAPDRLSPPRSIAWTISNIRSADDMEALKATLDRIDWADGGASLFQTSGWLSAVAGPVLAKVGSEIRVMLAFRGEAPVAALPIAISSTAGLRIARILGDPLTQYSDLLSGDWGNGEFGRTVAENAIAVLPSVDALIFRRVRDDARLPGAILAMGGRRIARSAAPYADLTQYRTFEEFLRSNWKAHRNRNRLRRRARNAGELAFVVERSSGPAAELTRRAIDLKRQWLRARFRSFGTLSSAAWGEALVAAVARPSSSTQSVVTALYSCGQPAAIEVGFVRRDRYYAFLGAFNPEFASWSPTELLMEDTVRWCFAHGIALYDLLPPDDPYKARWTNGSVPVSDWAICRSMAGRLYVELRERLLPPVAANLCNVLTRTRERLRFS